jgi:hypothetical protein
VEIHDATGSGTCGRLERGGHAGADSVFAVQVAGQNPEEHLHPHSGDGAKPS